ncbi:hypothetical protein LSCM1_05048 [Leishmania martiniquensis]|uniref:Uncharacterized protein n=1 Tax=Leishmania martiniquensis TaxID=1580590 RepID=A0A836H531_9TRYP|nr:hypothetical protein LSCM1_05048 [Leishmania martiniquensis]
MKKRRDVEIRTVAARPHKKGGTGTRREHRFPLYSHPMFRAALHNAAAVQSAVAEQSDRIDPRALDAALENMVMCLMKQQHETEGKVSPTTRREDLIVTEGQLLALLDEAMGTALQPSHPEPPASAFQPMSPGAVVALAPAATSPPSLERQFIPNQHYHISPPPLHANAYGARCATPPPHAQPVPISRAVSSGDNVLDELNVVSAASLLQATLASGGRSSEASALGLSPRSESAASARTARTTAEKTKVSGFRRANTRHPRLKTSPYSLLPPLVASSGLTATAALPVTDPSSRRPSPSWLSLAEMDRRPGISAGPLAQQSVDAQQLHQVPDAVFASMDVLMDANSCCLRRRRRLEATSGCKDAPLSLNPRGRGGAARPCFAFGCGSKGASLNRMYVNAVQNTLPSPPPPRTAAEAKARRILESQRCKQRLHDQQHNPVSDSSLLTDCGNNAQLHFSLPRLHGGPITLSTDPLGRHHRGQSGSRRCDSAHWRLRPTNPSASRSSLMAAGSASTLPPGPETLPLFTLRGIACESAYDQAVHSANRFGGALL